MSIPCRGVWTRSTPSIAIARRMTTSTAMRDSLVELPGVGDADCGECGVAEWHSEDSRVPRHVTIRRYSFTRERRRPCRRSSRPACAASRSQRESMPDHRSRRVALAPRAAAPRRAHHLVGRVAQRVVLVHHHRRAAHERDERARDSSSSLADREVAAREHADEHARRRPRTGKPWCELPGARDASQRAHLRRACRRRAASPRRAGRRRARAPARGSPPRTRRARSRRGAPASPS